MTQTKTWAIITLTLTWLLMSMTVQARGGLPEFTELVEKNADAVVNISTKMNKDDQAQPQRGDRAALHRGRRRPAQPAHPRLRAWHPRGGPP